MILFGVLLVLFGNFRAKFACCGAKYENTFILFHFKKVLEFYLPPFHPEDMQFSQKLTKSLHPTVHVNLKHSKPAPT